MTTVLRAARWADVVTGKIHAPAVIVVDDERISAMNPEGPLPDSATTVDLGDTTLLPGLMDMELNLLIGGPGGPEGLPSPMHGVQDDPAYRTLRGAVNARTTLEAGFTTVRNLGLMVKTGDICSTSRCNAPSTRAGTPGPGSIRPAMPSPRTAGIWTRRCFSGWPPGSCRCRWPRASPTGCPT